MVHADGMPGGAKLENWAGVILTGNWKLPDPSTTGTIQNGELVLKYVGTEIIVCKISQ